MMKKQKVFKFEEGKPGFFKRIGNSFKKFGQNVSEYVKGIDMEDLAGAIGGASQGIASSLGIEQERTGSVINGIGQLVSQVNPFVGAGLQMFGSTIGGSGSVDENTGEVTKASGLTKVFGLGKNNGELYRKAGRIKNTLVAREQTQNIQADYSNDPNVEVQPNVLAAEGGIMRRPVNALVSKGELIYDPVTKKLSKVPGSKGRPNRADDVYTRLYEGDVVLSNSPTMLMANGKTPAQNVERFINKKSKSSDGTVKAREAIIKKVVNWQEANKTKPQQYAMYDDGTSGAKVRLVHFDKDGNIVYGDPRTDIQPITKTRIGDIYEQGYQITTDGTQIDVSQPTTVEPTNATKKITPVKEMHIVTRQKERPFEGAKYVAMSDDRAKRYSDPEFLKHLNSYLGHKENVDLAYEQLKDLPQVKSAMIKFNNDKQKALKHLTSDGKYGNVMHYFYNDYIDKLNLDEWDFVEEDLDVPITKVPIDLESLTPRKIVQEPVEDKTGPIIRQPKKKKIGDVAYKAATLLSPLMDYSRPEAVNYETPIAKFRPTGVDVSKQLREIDDSYAMARYNQANISPNTGAGMAYGLQAAANRAKQMSDVYSWQTNAQNQLIGQNVDTFNDWSKNYATIMNNVYDQAAANRAASRNINKQNRATALNNWGQILRDDKQFNMDAMKLQMAKPMLEYGYKDYNQFLKWMEENGYDEQVR